MKKLPLLLLLFAIFITLVSCGGEEEPAPVAQEPAQEVAQPAPTDTPVPAVEPAKGSSGQFDVDDEVLVIFSQDEIYTATILEIDGGEALVRYDDDGSEEWLPLDVLAFPEQAESEPPPPPPTNTPQPQSSGGNNGQLGVGDAVLVVFSQDELYLATILEIDGGEALVRYDDDGSEEWLPLELLASPNADSQPSASQDSASSSGGQESSSNTGSSEGGAHSGFQPQVNGFSFPNYGNEEGATNLTAAEMQRMFGDQVCASQANGTCTLTPPVKRWLEQVNAAMSGGHCEGMAVLSALMYYGQANPGNFGGNVAHDLDFYNENLQREIAYWWVTQATYPGGVSKINESPNAVVDKLIETFEAGKNPAETWVMGIYKSDWTGGHAITPIGVEDKGNGIAHILVYDNNYPNETRVIEVDRNANAWQYEASINPNVQSEIYDGNAELQNLEIVAISPRLQQQECQACAGDGFSQAPSSHGLASPLPQNTTRFNEIWLEGDADLLITDIQGRRIGYVNGEFINEIPEAQSNRYKLLQVSVWDSDEEPVYRIPVGLEFTITVDASRVTEGVTSTVAMIGPGYNLIIEDLYLDPGEQDVIGVSPDGSELRYSTQYNDAPDMIFGVETPEADYEFIVAALDIEAGAEFKVKLDLENGDLSINTDNTTEEGIYEILMYSVDDEGESWFNNNDIYLEPGDTAYLNFLEWEGPGSSMFIDIDYGSDGELDESIELPDEFELEGE